MTTKRTLTKGLSAALLLIAAFSLPAASSAQGRRYGWDNWNRGYSRYNTSTFQLDGTFIGQQNGCALVQDRRGQVVPLVGNPGDFRRGEDLLMTGRVQYGSVCGTAFRVFSVDRIWSDSSHRRVLFDSRYDGDYYGYRNRYGDNRYNNDRYNNDRYNNGYNNDRYNNGYNNDRYNNGYNNNGYSDRYGNNGNRDLVTIVGRLDDSGRCPVIRGDRGEYYDLVGDLRNFRDGAHVQVLGFVGVRSSCGGQAIDVQQIR